MPSNIIKESSTINLAEKYWLAITNTDLDRTKKQQLINIKKYWRSGDTIEIEIDKLHDLISILPTFDKYLHGEYDN